MIKFANSIVRPVLALLGLSVLLAVSAQAQVIETPGDYVTIMDAESGDVLFEKNSDVPMAPASMSKLMTVALVFDALKNDVYTLDDTFPVSKTAWQKQGSKMWVLVDAEVRIEDLIRGIIVQSGNDACIVVAEGMAGSEEAFAEQMTAFGKEIGLTGSTFRNSTGWPDPEHMMTAHDLAVLARHLITEYPDYYAYFAELDFSWSDIKQPNRNPLLFLNVGADGLKTGHTEASGYGLTGSSIRNGRRLILVVNGLGSEKERANESRRLLEIAHREFKAYPLFAAGDEVVAANVWNGKRSTVPLVVEGDVKVQLHRKARRDLDVRVTYQDPIAAPVVAGTQVGMLKINAPGMAERQLPIFAGEDVAPNGVFGRLVTAIDTLISGSEVSEAPAE